MKSKERVLKIAGPIATVLGIVGLVFSTSIIQAVVFAAVGAIVGLAIGALVDKLLPTRERKTDV